MRTVLLIPLVFAACSSPSINVKEKWTNSILNYSFIPLYPMREDVYVGDVRIHRLDANEGHGLYSRYLTKIDVGLGDKETGRPSYAATGKNVPVTKNGVTSWTQAARANSLNSGSDPDRLRLMSLPKIEAARITEADARGGGVLGAWNLLLDGSISRQENLLVSLTGIETAEISDVSTAARFRDTIKHKLVSDHDFLVGVCAAANAMADPDMNQTAISMVTRVAYARGIEYKYGDSFNASLKATATPTAGGQDQKIGGKRKSEDTVSQHEVFDRPMAFGVDAVMLNPKSLLPGIVGKCDKELEDFRFSPRIAGKLTAARPNPEPEN